MTHATTDHPHGPWTGSLVEIDNRLHLVYTNPDGHVLDFGQVDGHIHRRLSRVNLLPDDDLIATRVMLGGGTF